MLWLVQELGRDRVSFSEDLDNSRGSFQPFQRVVIRLCPIVHRVRGNSACARRFLLSA